MARTAAWLCVLALVVTTFGVVASRSEPEPPTASPRGDVAAAARAIDALVHPGPSPDALALLPHDFTAVTGVTTEVARAPDGTVRVVHADGGCSAPWGDDPTRWDFGVPCRAHDLGYDLLRYAEQKGQPLGPDVRRALDDRLTADMQVTCEVNAEGSRDACRSVAWLYSAGLVVNSWHQRWGPPVGEPIAPLLAGVAAIGCLVSFRLRGRLRARRREPSPRAPGAPVPAPIAVPGRRWTLLGVAAITVLVVAEAAVALAGWVGARDVLWPLTWLAQLSFVFFFAGGKTNAAGWLAVSRSGGGYREYLAHRASWLLRLTLVFAVVAFAVPTALELLDIPRGTVEAVVRIALHPLWLLGVYVLTVVATPAMLAAHRRAPLATPLTLTGLLLAVEGCALASGWALGRHVGPLLLALLAQQLAFVHDDGRRPWPAVLWSTVLGGGAVLAAGAITGVVPRALLGTPTGSPMLSGPTLPVLMLGLVHLSALVLLRRPLVRIATRPRALRVAAFASRAPMSLYLVFLAAVLLVVATVYVPDRLGSDPAWLLRPRTLVAIAMLAGPAVVVFVWFERHLGHRGPPAWRSSPTRVAHVLAYAATVAGLGYATAGVFGLALTSLGTAQPALAALEGSPVQSVLHLVLGMALLHSVRTGVSGSPRTWLLTAAACVPPVLSATADPTSNPVGVVVHVTTGLLAVMAAILAVVTMPRQHGEREANTGVVSAGSGVRV